MWQDVQAEALREYDYMASCANLNSSLSIMMDNINISWSGFNDSMPNYISETIYWNTIKILKNYFQYHLRNLK